TDRFVKPPAAASKPKPAAVSPKPAQETKSKPVAKPKAGDKPKAVASPKASKPKAATKPAPSKPAPKSKSPAKDAKPKPKPSTKPKKPAATKETPKRRKTVPKGKWTHDLRLGLDQRFSIVDQTTFHTRLKSRYTRGVFKAQSDFSYSYGETETTTTADRFKGLLKADVTIKKDLYLYGNGTSSFDLVRRIKRRWEFGVGAGYRVLKDREFLIKGSKLAVDLETGAEYQEQKSTRDVSSQTYLWRLGQSATWQVNKDLKVSAEFDFFPRIGELPSHRYRSEGNIAYRLLKTLSLNFTVLAEAYPETLQDIEPDDLQFRTSLGWTF
ncbi:MAG: DUF481 domain-containing protein, partial [Limisphaerales bacterium]